MAGAGESLWRVRRHFMVTTRQWPAADPDLACLGHPITRESLAPDIYPAVVTPLSPPRGANDTPCLGPVCIFLAKCESEAGTGSAAARAPLAWAE